MTTLPPETPTIHHHGAVNGVTGSCHHYRCGDDEYLIDCGLFQGDERGGRGDDPHFIDFDLSRVRALIVTHVHIDHIGRLPYLVAAGFHGPIICSIPSARLLPLVIEDAMKIGVTRDEQVIELFKKSVQQQLVPLEYNTWHTLLESPQRTLKVRLQRAGHILGSAYVELALHEGKRRHRTVFSGDLGAPHAPLLPAPKSPHGCDTLVIESTYGDSVHEDRRSRKGRLKAAIEHAMANGGTVIVPAFSIGRTQELLYELEDLISRGDAGWRQLQVVVDSPLAARFTEVYESLKPYWDQEAQQRLRAGRHPLSFDNLITVDSHADHMKVVRHLADTRQPAVVLAASGMATGGRVMNYLTAMLEDPHHAVLFVGYQARGTPGFYIQKYGSPVEGGRHGYVELDGRRYEIRAQVFTIGGYSAHADQKGLVNFVKRMRKWPSEVRIVHGDPGAKAALKEKYEALARERGVEMAVLIPEE